MKYLLALLLLSSFAASGQDCSLIRETDPYTKLTRISTGFISLPDARLNIEADGKEVDLFFIVTDRCFADGSNVYVYFEGMKARMFYRNTGSMNCDGYVHLKFRQSANPPAQLKRFATHKVTQFIFLDRDKKEKVITLTTEQQDNLQKLATCLLEEAGKT